MRELKRILSIVAYNWILSLFSKTFFQTERKSCSSKILQYSQENTCVYEKETPTQMFSCEYCEMFQNTYFKEHVRTAVPVSHPRSHLRVPH